MFWSCMELERLSQRPESPEGEAGPAQPPRVGLNMPGSGMPVPASHALSQWAVAAVARRDCQCQLYASGRRYLLLLGLASH